ncbi:MAG: ABC transporter permease, partial [Ignavibacteriae bacterium]
PEPASGTVLSIPEDGQPLLNKLHMRTGRWIDEGRDDEVIVSAAFSAANGFKIGDQFNAVINGRWRRLTIVGTALSPEYVLEVRPGTMLIDNKRYGIMWMGRKVLAAAYDMSGAFNSATVRLEAGANSKTVREEIDLILKPYGSIGAIDREEQTSHRFLTDEIRGVRVTALIVPTIFLGVAIFLLNIALLRLVGTQRTSIAILKSFGYSNFDIGIHYIGFAMVAVILGSILGLIGGQYLGVAMVELYTRFYRFPVLRFDMPNGVIAASMLLAAFAAILGAVGAVRTVVKLPPAEAMRPESPKSFKPGILERIPLFRRLDPLMAMIWRNIERRPFKSTLSVLMIGLAMAILVIGRSMFDMFDVLMDVQFNSAMRSDAVVAFTQNRSSSVLYDLEHLPGVMYVETFRAVPVDIVHGRHQKRLAITSIGEHADLKRVVDKRGDPVAVASEGLTITEYLARSMQIRVGDSITVKLLEGDRRELRMCVSATVDEMFGVQAYMADASLRKLLREEGSISGAFVQIDIRSMDAFSKKVKTTPAVASVMVRETAIKSFDDNYRENMDISTVYMVGFAVIIAFGV